MFLRKIRRLEFSISFFTTFIDVISNLNFKHMKLFSSFKERNVFYAKFVLNKYLRQKCF